MNITNTVNKTFRKIINIFKSPIIRLQRKVQRAVSPDSIMSTIVSDIKKEVKAFGSDKELSLKDYFLIGDYYIRKSAVFIAAALMILSPLLYLKYVHPVIISKFFTKTIVVNSSAQYGYNGKVRLLSEKNGAVIFIGELTDGRINGEGELYDYDGSLVYKGDFVQEMMSGSGELYYKNGMLRYMGEFLLNNFDGEGCEYNEDGTVKYKGSFSEGEYEGDGRLYNKGVIIYDGEFVDGLYEGKGILYDNGVKIFEGTFSNGIIQSGNAYDGCTFFTDEGFQYEGGISDGVKAGYGILRDEEGRVVYDGEFSNDVYDGTGRLYENGNLIYDGEFLNGIYDGTGRLYENGNLLYEGDFVNGLYEGSGKLYNPAGKLLVYEGGFRLGLYDGEGKQYTDWGVLRYEGGFILGVYNGYGILHDGHTAEIIAEGEFLYGLLSAEKASEAMVIEIIRNENETEEITGNYTESISEAEVF